MQIPPRKSILALAVLVASSVVGARAEAEDVKTYLSLGDSLAFGYTDPQHVVPSLGDQGYVKPYADALAARDGGNRPHVVNLALFGETTGSFFGAGGPPARENEAALGMPATSLNLNYPNAATSQNDLLLSTIGAEQKAGRQIDRVTVSLGANDLFAL